MLQDVKQQNKHKNFTILFNQTIKGKYKIKALILQYNIQINPVSPKNQVNQDHSQQQKNHLILEELLELFKQIQINPQLEIVNF